MKTLKIIISLCVISISTLAQPKNIYEVYAIEYVKSSSWTPATNIAVGALKGDSVLSSFFIWYLKGDNDKKILVDAGFLADSSKHQRYLQNYRRPDSALAKLNVDANEITDIIITHPHWDHINGIRLFKKATIWMQKKDYAYFVGEAWQKGAKNIGYDKQDVIKIVQANLDGRLRFVDGDSLEIIPGIRVFIGSKHSYESQYVLVATKTDNVLLASDDCWYYYNLEHLLPVILLFDADAYVRGLQRMKKLVKDHSLIIPGHDALVLTRFPKVAEGIVRIR